VVTAELRESILADAQPLVRLPYREVEELAQFWKANVLEFPIAQIGLVLMNTSKKGKSTQTR
jgi:hypothetical protein